LLRSDPYAKSGGGFLSAQLLVVLGKRGNTYLRTQLINGARAALNQVEKKSAKVRVWAKQLKGRSSFNNACVALANRMAWATLHHQ
jgi:transposase